MKPEPPTSRQVLVELAAEEFAEKGYAGVSVRDLAARSQVTTGAIYHHFKGKPDLLLAAIDAHIVDDLEEVPTDSSAGLAAALAAIFGDYPSRERLRALMVEGAIAAKTDPQARERLHVDTQDRLKGWADTYEQWQEQGGIDPDLDVYAFLVSLWSIELGLGVLEALGVDLPSPEAMDDVIERFVGVVTPPAKTGRSAKRPTVTTEKPSGNGASDTRRARPTSPSKR
jgi:AcrR family transcriptional regulator